MLRFLIFASFFQIRQKIPTVYQIFQFLTLFGMEFKKSAKTHENEKTQHMMGCFKLKKEFKLIFRIFVYF